AGLRCIELLPHRGLRTPRRDCTGSCTSCVRPSDAANANAESAHPLLSDRETPRRASQVLTQARRSRNGATVLAFKTSIITGLPRLRNQSNASPTEKVWRTHAPHHEWERQPGAERKPAQRLARALLFAIPLPGRARGVNCQGRSVRRLELPGRAM